MCSKVILGLPFVRFQGSIENGFEARGSCGYGWRLGHGRSGDCGGIEENLPIGESGNGEVNTGQMVYTWSSLPTRHESYTND